MALKVARIRKGQQLWELRGQGDEEALSTMAARLVWRVFKTGALLVLGCPPKGESQLWWSHRYYSFGEHWWASFAILHHLWSTQIQQGKEGRQFVNCPVFFRLWAALHMEDTEATGVALPVRENNAGRSLRKPNCN